MNKTFFETQGLYRLFFDNSLIGIVFCDKEMTITEINERAVQIFGSTREKLLGFNLRNMKDKRLIPASEDALSGKRGSYDGQYFPTTGTSGEIYILLRTEPVFDAEGKVTGAFALIEDITEKKKGEIKLKEREEYYRNLLDSLNDIVYELELDGTVRYINKAASRLLGYDMSEFVGADLSKFMHPEDVSRIAKAMEDFLKTGSDVKSEEFRVMKKSGEIIYLREHSVLNMRDGKLIGMVGVASDITERKKAELELEERVKEQERLNSLMVNREVRMVDLKEEIKQLKANCGEK